MEKVERREQVINSFGSFVVDHHIGLDIRDVSELPHSKKEILDAITLEILRDTNNDKKIVNNLRITGVMLANFQENVGSKLLTMSGITSDDFCTVDAINDSELEELILKARSYPDRKKYKSFNKIVEQEKAGLYSKLASYAKGKLKYIGLAKTISLLRQDIDVFKLIYANSNEIVNLGMGKSYFAYAYQAAVNSIVLNISKIYEKEKITKNGEARHDLNSIDGVMRSLAEPWPNGITETPIDEFIEKYSSLPQNTDLRSALVSTIENFREHNKNSLERFETHRHQFGAHSQFGFEQKDLPPHEDIEKLFKFAYDFYGSISSSFFDAHPIDLENKRQVKVGLKSILRNHGLNEVKDE